MFNFIKETGLNIVNSFNKSTIKNIKSGNININGNKFSGSNMTIVNNKVMIDGKEIQYEKQKNIIIIIEGDVETIETASGDVTCKSTGSVKTMSGDVEVQGSVTGNVSTMSGDVEVNGNINGNVSTMSGDIN